MIILKIVGLGTSLITLNRVEVFRVLEPGLGRVKSKHMSRLSKVSTASVLLSDVSSPPCGGNGGHTGLSSRRSPLQQLRRTLLLFIVTAASVWAQVPNWSPVTAAGPAYNDWFKIVYDPVAQCTRMWTAGPGIYSDTMYCVKANGAVQQIWTTGNTNESVCPADTTIPTDRHPLALLAVDTKRQLLWMAAGVNINCWANNGNMYDMWYEVLQPSYTGSNALLTKVQPGGGWTSSNYPQEIVNANSGALVYDSDDDALYMFGYNLGNQPRTWVYCPTIPAGGGQPTGILTGTQSQTGCSPDVWTSVTQSGPSGFTAGEYDPVNHVIVAFDPNAATWSFNPRTRTWANQNPSSHPPANTSFTQGWDQNAMVFVPTLGVIYLHDPTTPADWSYNYATNTWTNLGSRGGETQGDTMTYNASANALITWPSNGATGVHMYVGVLGAAPCSIAPSGIRPWTVGQSVSQTFSESGCNAGTFSLSGAWPTGISGCSSGSGPSCSVSGIITGSAGTFTTTISYANATLPLTMTVNPQPSITTTSLLAATAGSSYSQAIATSGGTAPITCTADSGLSGSGLTVSGCTVTGTAGTAGSYTVTVTARDANGIATSQAISLTVNQGGQTVQSGPAPPNNITLTNVGSTESNHPVQIGRAFAQGEIPGGKLPQATISGVGAVATQVDVKNRWADGSLKYAIISFLVPAFTPNTPYTVSFASGTTVGNTPLTQPQMLASGFNFDAQMQLTKSGTTKSASARAMLQGSSSIPDCATINWAASGSSGINACYWTQGPIATTVIIANHAQRSACGGRAASTYDFGFDSFCPIRPIFEATFWGSTNQVRVRYVGELTNTEQSENVAIDSMALMLGNSNPATVYTNSALTMSTGSRWTKTYWLNGTPQNANLNHNAAYLAYTNAVPNYDTTKSFSSSIINTAYTSNWLGAASECSSGATPGLDLYQAGEWNANGVCGDVTQGGGHDWVGPMPAWTNRWLYSGDYRMQLESLGNADLAGAFGIHFREGNSSKYLDRAGTVPGLGRVVSISSRPLLCFTCSGNGFMGGNSANGSAFQTVGAGGNLGFGQDPAHMPELYIEYLLTGEHYYLEENLFWNGWATWFAQYIPGYYWYRGPTGAEGGIPDQNGQMYQLRGQGWTFLGRAQTAFATPDAMPEQSYFDLLTKDAIAKWEGERNITNGFSCTSYANGVCTNASNSEIATEWTFGYNGAFTVTPVTNRFWTTCGGCGDPDPTTWLGVPPLHFWDLGNQGQCDNNITNLSTINGCYKNWMYSFVAYSLGRAAELGYNTTPLVNWAGYQFVGMLTDPGYNPWLIGSYITPTTKLSGPAHYTSFADLKSAYVTSVQNETGFGTSDILETNNGEQYNGNGWTQPFAAATSYMTNLTGGGPAWAWINANLEPAIGGNGCGSTALCDLKWAIVPRSITQMSGGGTSGQGSACDLNADGVVNSTDVQLAINQALGTTACGSASLDGSGTCTAVDVQRVINASLGQSCRVGP